MDNRNLNLKIYFYIRDEIINNHLKPGSRIDYNKLATELGVSKTPVRDALQRLHQDGLIEVQSRSGTYVSTPKEKDVEEIFDVRKALERQAVSLAIRHLSKETLNVLYDETIVAESEIDRGNFQPFFQADRKFHKTLINHSNSSRLIKIMESLEVQIMWIGVIIAYHSERPRLANAQHQQIISALLDANTPLAQDLMEEHIESIKQMTLIDFKNNSEINQY
ncbi:GntR family transcriptional regulator [Bacillus sp. MRMR6]|uniref:GntR family transcriptional regulator n=1 Tax=Bacillus sp. MRMR6 TaxID=1928617 RepID=UPI0020C969D4|nr:GntR family transcriptional regulator [Bacillus sp. MRMR6]